MTETENIQPFKVGNCRGTKPMIKDYCKIIQKMDAIKFELNSCYAKTKLDEARHALYLALQKAGYELSPDYKPINVKP